MKKIFFKIVEIFRDTIDTGIFYTDDCSCKINDGTIEMEYLDYAIKLIARGKIPDFLNYSLETRIHYIISKNDLDQKTIERLFLIKHLAPAIQTRNFKIIQEFMSNLIFDSDYDTLSEEWKYLKDHI